MSATQIIAEIESLPTEERQRVFAYVRDKISDSAAGGQHPEVDDKFKAIADDMFKTNAELFRKLAR
ncbi:MAG: hypothetical protein HY301_14575 [Verrucomicrobia bacterium]|nr:hypothetical protein [Verrucomicrobiota bacterium]